MATKFLTFLNVLPIQARTSVLNIYIYIHMTAQCTHLASLKPTAQPQDTVYANYELTVCNSYS